MRLFKFTSIAMAAALLVAGCAQDRLIINSNNGDGDLSNQGYLSVSGLSADCRIDEHDTQHGTEPVVVISMLTPSTAEFSTKRTRRSSPSNLASVQQSRSLSMQVTTSSRLSRA